ncbi:M15 family metallopeptidase [Candidatus Parcubacteria bacterium]|nr:M15 family metallopeptidase [Candidatus Parcubacteria bacterium]
MTLGDALAGKDIPEDIKKNLTLTNVKFFSFDREVREGQLVIHAAIAGEVQEIFEKLAGRRFPIQQIVPIVAHNWDDNVSMAANNTSAFNYRVIFGTDRLSNHSYGRAIDINPLQNPYLQCDGVLVPSGACYDPTKPGTITPEIASLFKSYGWDWGGDWVQQKDWQHFEKTRDA